MCLVTFVSFLSLNLSSCPVCKPQHLQHALFSALHFLRLPLKDNTFFSNFLWGLRLKENKSGKLGVNVLSESLTKGLLALRDGSYHGCMWKTLVVLLRRPDFQVKIWRVMDNMYIMLIAFAQQIAFGNLGIIAITQKKLYIVKKKNWNATLSLASECGHSAMSKSMFMLKHS